jgi:hypothetical protein
LIGITNACLSPNTMMIHFINTFFACATMRNSRKFILIANFTVFTSEIIFIIKELLILIFDIKGFSKGRYFVFYSDCLYVAPKAHEDIEKC